MFGRFFRVYLLVVLIVLALDWALGVARFYWPAVTYGFAIVNFPIGLGYLWLEGQSTTWWHMHFGQAVNDEIGQSIAFLLTVALQALLYTAVFLVYRRSQSTHPEPLESSL